MTNMEIHCLEKVQHKREAQRHSSYKKNLDLEAKVESLQKELVECNVLLHQSRAEVSAHHIV